MEEIYLLGIKVTSAKVWELHYKISRIIASGRQGFVLSANIHGFNMARKMPWLADFYNTADLVHCDGAGIILGVKIFGKHIPERITYADWGWLFTDYCALRKHTLYLLGGPQGLAEEAKNKLVAYNPNIEIKGVYHGYFKKQGPENEAVIEDINRAKPDIILVGMGMGLQEKWILNNHTRINAKVFMVCGAAFRYWSGWTSRCPPWMAKIGFEWLYRFLQEPRRMCKRYLWGNTIFMVHVIIAKLRQQVRRSIP